MTVDEEDNVTCTFNGVESEGIVVDEDSVLCISPQLPVTGRVPFKVSIISSDPEKVAFTGESSYTSCKRLQYTTVLDIMV